MDLFLRLIRFLDQVDSFNDEYCDILTLSLLETCTAIPAEQLALNNADTDINAAIPLDITT
jgi:hypothetical protein